MVSAQGRRNGRRRRRARRRGHLLPAVATRLRERGGWLWTKQVTRYHRMPRSWYWEGR